MKRKSERPVWYRLTWKDRLVYGAAGGIIAFFILMIFYRSFTAAWIGAIPSAFLYPHWKKKEIFSRRKQEITREFKESLYTLSASLRAGESLESAFASTVREMDAESYPYLYESWRRILAKIRLQRRLEDLLQEFAADTQIDEIQSFAQIIAVSKRTQGEITTIIDHTAQLLQEKIEMKQELIVLLAKKKTEQRIMNLMPFLVIGMLTTVSPEYMAPLYGTLNGRIVMTVCILLAGGSIWMSKVFSEIRV